MKEYTRPVAIVTDGISEGVFMASGAAEGGNSAVSGGNAYSLNQTAEWDGNKNYDIVFTNNSDKKVDSVTVTLKLNGTVTKIDGGVSAVISGSTATISFNNWGNGLEANASSGAIYMHVEGQGDFSVE